MIESTVIDKIKAKKSEPWKSLQDYIAENENLKAQVLALQSKLDEIKKQITEHNQMCIDLCADKTNCGFALYDRDCGNCKKDFMIDAGKS